MKTQIKKAEKVDFLDELFGELKLKLCIGGAGGRVHKRKFVFAVNKEVCTLLGWSEKTRLALNWEKRNGKKFGVLQEAKEGERGYVLREDRPGYKDFWTVNIPHGKIQRLKTVKTAKIRLLLTKEIGLLFEEESGRCLIPIEAFAKIKKESE